MLNEVFKIHRNTGIFLLKKTMNHPIMYGVFLADGPPGRDIEPRVLGGKCPAQVRVKQCYKFCPLPWSTFKNMFEGNNAKGVKRGLRITAEQTLDLITKFIIATRLVLSHRVISNLTGDIGKQIKRIDQDWVRERMLLLRHSLEWQKKIITGGALPFRFVPAFMAQGGTIDDFIWAVRSIDAGKEDRKRTNFFHEDWKKFLNIVQELAMLNGYVEDIKGFANQMEDLMSILSQASAPLGAHHPAIQIARCCGSRACERSFVRTCGEPNLQQNNANHKIHRRSRYTPECTNNDLLSSYGWQPQSRCSLNYPCENNRYVLNSAMWSPRYTDERKHYDDYSQGQQRASEEEKRRAPYISCSPDCFTDDDLDEFGRRNLYNHLEELAMMTEVSFCAQKVLPETPVQQRHFTEHFGRATPTRNPDSFGHEHTYAQKAQQQNDDGLWGPAPCDGAKYQIY